MSRDADMRFGHCKCSLHLAHAGGVLRHAPLWWRSAGTGGRGSCGGARSSQGRQQHFYPRFSGPSIAQIPKYNCDNIVCDDLLYKVLVPFRFASMAFDLTALFVFV